MKNAKNKTVLGLMILAAIVSGCTGGGGGTEEDEGSTSLTVNEFSAFPNPVPGGQNVQFRLQLVNDGDQDVDTAYARLYNPPFGEGNQVFSTGSGDKPTTSDLTLEFDELRAEGDQTPAIAKTAQQNFQAPGLSRGRNIGYGFKSDIFFEYTTTATAEVRIMGEEAYRDAGSPQGSVGLENSRGPIQLEVRTPAPVRVFESSEGSVTKSFCVIARNQGQGTPFDPSDFPSSETFDRSTIQEEEDEVEIDIQDIGSQVTFSPQDGDSDTLTKQIYNGEASGCFDMEVSSVSPTTERTIPVQVEANYGYKKTANSQLRVEGRGTSQNEEQQQEEDGGQTQNTQNSGVEDPKPDTEYRYTDGDTDALSNSLTGNSYSGEDYSEELSFEINQDNSDDQQDLACGLLKEYQENSDFSQELFRASCDKQ